MGASQPWDGIEPPSLSLQTWIWPQLAWLVTRILRQTSWRHFHLRYLIEFWQFQPKLVYLSPSFATPYGQNILEVVLPLGGFTIFKSFINQINFSNFVAFWQCVNFIKYRNATTKRHLAALCSLYVTIYLISTVPLIDLCWKAFWVTIYNVVRLFLDMFVQDGPKG